MSGFGQLNKYTSFSPVFKDARYTYWNVEADHVPPCDLTLGDVTIPRAHPIGAGAYGLVYRGIATTASGSSVPVVVKMTKVAREDPPRSYQAEVLAHWGLSSTPNCSPAVACMLGAFRTHLGNPANEMAGMYHYCIVLEQMAGDLYELARAARASSEPGPRLCLALRMAMHIIYDVLWMFVRGYHHNDVKPENFLYRWSAGLYSIKISDLGLACLRGDGRADPRAIAHRKAVRAAALSSMYEDAVAIDLSEILERHEPVLDCHPAGTRIYMSPLMLAKYDAGRPATLEEHAYNDFYGAAVSARVLMAVMNLIGGLDGSRIIIDDINMAVLRSGEVNLVEPLASMYADTPAEIAFNSLGFLLVAPPGIQTPIYRASMAEHVLSLLYSGIDYLERTGSPAPPDIAPTTHFKKLPPPPIVRSETMIID